MTDDADNKCAYYIENINGHDDNSLCFDDGIMQYSNWGDLGFFLDIEQCRELYEAMKDFFEPF